jgi:hypothetical protein
MSQKMYIGPYQSGLQKNVEPFMLPEEAFTQLEDAYVWRGRVKKKDGYTFLGRLHLSPTLPEALANVNTGATTYTATLANAPVSPGTVVIVISTPGPMTFTDNGNGTLTSLTATANYGTIDYESGTFTLNFDPALPGGGPFAVNATAYRYLTRSPVMGLGLYEALAVNQEDLIAHDQDHSYLFNTATNVFDELTVGTWGVNNQWTSSDSDFVWTTNYFTDAANNKLHWATNNIAYNANFQDGIQFYNGASWITQQTQIDSTPNYLRGSLLILPYRDRLVALNTLEGPAPGVGGAVRYPNRARWSQNGTPLISVDANAWREDIIGKGGFIDAATSEAIVSAAFNKDTLIVFFERSTWRLRYTGNEILPFVWEQINSEYGAESTFSAVIFDKGVLSVADKRIVAADSINVTPIDDKIPDEVYNFHNDNEGPKRVHGIRDFFRKLVYWTFPNDDPNEIFPDKVLVFNYDNDSWAIYNDSFTTFGRWQKRTDYTWATLPYSSWAEWTVQWGDARAQSFFPNIIAGNQKGFVLILDNTSSNQESLDLVNTIPIPTISNTAPAVFGLPDHNLKINQFVKFVDCPAFGINIVGENIGLAVQASTQFRGTLANIGVFPSTIVVTIGALSYQDLGDGTLIETTGGVNRGTINYETGEIILNYAALAVATVVTVNYTYNILNSRVFKVVSTTQNSFQLAIVNSDDSLTSVNFNSFGAPFTGAGKIEVINNFKVTTKRFSPFLQEENGVRFSYIDIFLKKAPGAFITEVLPDQDSSVPVRTITVSSSDEDIAGFNPEKIWKRVFVNSISGFIQFQLRMGDFQMTQFQNYSSQWELHASNLLVSKAGRVTGGL